MSISEFVRILGRGPGRSRSLTQEEAREAMTRVLAGQAAPEAIGAMLMLMRMKGETPEELAGFTEALRQTHLEVPTPALDWPSYAAGRTRGLPWFLLSARLVARLGHPVLLHGWNGLGESGHFIREGLPFAQIPICEGPKEAAQALKTHGIAYLPLESFCPILLNLLKLREHLGLRSCLNTVARMLNPGRAEASVQGVFHPSYRELQMDASEILGLKNMSVIKGGGGEFERNPSKDIQVFGLREGRPFDDLLAPIYDDARRLKTRAVDCARLAALWSGDEADEFAEAIVIGTAALALQTLGLPKAEDVARAAWQDRLA